MDISVVVPLYNEEESLPELVEWIDKVMVENNFSYEIVMVDDGSNDKSWEVICELSKKFETVKAIKFRRNYGKSAALNTAFERVSGDVVITMDADLQDSPDEIPELYKMVIEDDYDIVSGWKRKRYDSKLTKNLPSKIYNYFSRKMTGIKLHDMNCGLKAYKNKVVKNIEVYGDMHRYIPVIAKWAGFNKIGEKVVTHQKRKYGKSKFGWERFINGFLDLQTIMFVSRFSKKPMHFFGGLGVLIFIIGFIIAAYLVVTRLFFGGYGMTTRPLFYFGLLAMVLGTMFFLTGFLAELISRSSSDRNKYSIDEEINL
ncbi:MAG: glycosyltransferase family 2 protein [Bacteroidales bacterium]|jgi:glycosyltransferase involved in cell wall biosynthesis